VSDEHPNLFATTRERPLVPISDAIDKSPCLTILYHPAIERIGDRARLLELIAGEPAELSRLAPLFAAPGPGEPAPLADPFVSRKPLHIEPDGDGVKFVRGASSMPVTVDGVPVAGELAVSTDAIDAGAIVEVSDRVVLLLHRLGPIRERAPRLGLIGESPAMEQLRLDILRAVDVEAPVLLRGETGTGKELVANAIHAASPRAASKCVSVNMAAIPATTAASELFGHAKGAFSGAVRDHHGYFGEANGGTLFLDEIGDAGLDIQPMLLRALESGEVQRVGAASVESVNVRLIAATDANLQTLVDDGRFRMPLYHRLTGYQIQLPPLRERRGDIGRLFGHFLLEELAAIGSRDRLEGAMDSPQLWLPASIVARMCHYRWPGNVRELRNFVRQLVIANRDATQVSLPPPLEASLGSQGAVPVADVPAPETTLSEDQLIKALRAHRWRLGPTANSLGMSRASLYARIDKSDRIRKAKDITKDELLTCKEACGGDLDAMSEKLEVSKRGIQLRMKDLGI